MDAILQGAATVRLSHRSCTRVVKQRVLLMPNRELAASVPALQIIRQKWHPFVNNVKSALPPHRQGVAQCQPTCIDVRASRLPVGVWLATKIVLEGARPHVAGNGVPLHLPAPITFLVKINAAWHRDPSHGQQVMKYPNTEQAVVWKWRVQSQQGIFGACMILLRGVIHLP